MARCPARRLDVPRASDLGRRAVKVLAAFRSPRCARYCTFSIHRYSDIRSTPSRITRADIVPIKTGYAKSLDVTRRHRWLVVLTSSNPLPRSLPLFNLRRRPAWIQKSGDLGIRE
jgi:hypothetical protein